MESQPQNAEFRINPESFHPWCQCVMIQFLKSLSSLELSENLTIAPLQCLACSKRPECLRILSGNIFLTSIKGNNSLTNLPK